MWVVDADFSVIFTVGIFILILLDMVLIAGAMARFQRARLILTKILSEK